MTSPLLEPNRLLGEASPYLRQHARNPVDWYPWGTEALNRAKAEDKPIFLSIGYAACHWCHVMERESFEDHEVADLLNRHFVSIKVDREERPDLDQLYMSAVVAMTRRGGWPMSVFLTPDAQPFFAGTYFPPEDRYGMPSFRRLLESLIAAWQQRRQDVLASASSITEHLADAAKLVPSQQTLQPDHMQMAIQQWQKAFDPQQGGFGHAPKFPHPIELQLMLRAAKRFGDQQALAMAQLTLDRMAAGGINDQLAGGFHRYSTDAQWLVPHFEKMLYDNALLAQTYLLAYQQTGQMRYREVVEQTLKWVQNEMISPTGAFYSTLDADSEGVEGKFYVWLLAEVERVLGHDAAWFAQAMDVTQEGNWEGHCILRQKIPLSALAEQLGISLEEMRHQWEKARLQLLQHRQRRTRPARDEKMIVAWNGMMIKAFAQAGLLLDDQLLPYAKAAAHDILQHLSDPTGRLWHSRMADTPPKQLAFLDDYAFFIDALVSLHEATGELPWLDEAERLLTVMLDEFWDAKEGGFYFIGRSQEPLLLRTKETHDDATPAGVSMAVTVLLRMAYLWDRPEWKRIADQTLQLYAQTLITYPTAMSQMLCALDFQTGPVREWVVIGEPGTAEMRNLQRAIALAGSINQVLFGPIRPEQLTTLAERWPLLRGKEAQVSPAVYLCEAGTCEAPLRSLEQLQKRLRED